MKLLIFLILESLVILCFTKIINIPQDFPSRPMDVQSIAYTARVGGDAMAPSLDDLDRLSFQRAQRERQQAQQKYASLQSQNSEYHQNYVATTKKPYRARNQYLEYLNNRRSDESNQAMAPVYW